MNDMQMLHGQKRADAHPVGNLKRHKAVSKPLLPLELRRYQRAAGKRLGNALRVFKCLNA